MNCALALIAIGFSFGQPVRAEESLDPHLEPLRPFLNKTYRGVFKNSTPEKPLVDVMRMERVMNGKAIRSMHSLNEGEYGGETLIYWDEEKKAVAFFYLTTGGFRTEGTLDVAPGKYSSIEEVKGNANGISKVRGTSEIKSDGTILVVAEYFANEKWVPGRETVYKEDPSAKIIFK